MSTTVVYGNRWPAGPARKGPRTLRTKRSSRYRSLPCTTFCCPCAAGVDSVWIVGGRPAPRPLPRSERRPKGARQVQSVPENGRGDDRPSGAAAQGSLRANGPQERSDAIGVAVAAAGAAVARRVPHPGSAGEERAPAGSAAQSPALAEARRFAFEDAGPVAVVSENVGLRWIAADVAGRLDQRTGVEGTVHDRRHTCCSCIADQVKAGCGEDHQRRR